MTYETSLSKRPRLRFWGWGYESESLSPEEDKLIESVAHQFMPAGTVEAAPPSVDDFDLRPPRFRPPGKLEGILSDTPFDRLAHCYGKSYADMVRMYLRQADNAPDFVAFPRNEEDIRQIFEYAGQNQVAVVPFGGGTSVCGGVEADVGASYAGAISLDMQHFDRLLDVDGIGRRARFQAGILGPDLEQALKPHGLTLRHFPQSFVFSSLGGWIATRASGHYATLYTHIDDLVEATRIVTPQGVIRTAELPGSGAGPSADRLILGSEGVLGVITEATMRLQRRPRWRASATVAFGNMGQGTEAARAISQAGLFPSNCRLLDEAEVTLNRIAEQPCSLLVLGFESADHSVEPWMRRAIEIARDHGGDVPADGVVYSSSDAVSRSGEAGSWRNAFIRMPYYRNRLTALGIIADTFETAVTWDRFPRFYQAIRNGLVAAIKEITGQDCGFSCRFTHVYPDGPAPYFTFYAVGDTGGNLRNALDKWRDIKVVANRLVVEFGGTITHHHAVGRDHRAGYEQQTSPLFREALAAAKSAVDPHGIMNPGVLIDPANRHIGITGALADKYRVEKP
ncbi:MAG: FAD-binding oxidoreductase [Gammaproteobacteria bacterium]|nr:FAD-binding oxidoreductase [Gammaproteobacteria bacterium]MDH3430899.1 FAD-binding oxidoreductase [Gammaproteobacteria bacterium]